MIWPELTEKEKAKLVEANRRWVAEGCPMPDACAYSHSIIEQIAGVQLMSDMDLTKAYFVGPCVAKEK